MSGYFADLKNRYFYRSSILPKKAVMGFCTCVALVSIALFGLHGGTINNTAEAKGKYFSGKTSSSRAHHRSSRKHVRSHRTSTRHFRGNRVKHRSFANNRHRSFNRHTSRHGRYNNFPSRYRSLSYADASNTYLRTRVGNTRTDHRQNRHHRHYRSRYNTINGVVITGAALIPQTELNRFIERDDATGVSVIYFNKKKCDQGYDCIMRIGSKRSSAKIIVVGQKPDRFNEGSKAPRIIYPPN